MKNKDLQLFANRPWEATGEADAEYWLARKKRLGPAEGLRMAAELRALVAVERPDWPSSAERQADLDVHTRVSEALRRVQPARAP